jgi:hypothetical protein
MIVPRLASAGPRRPHRPPVRRRSLTGRRAAASSTCARRPAYFSLSHKALAEGPDRGSWNATRVRGRDSGRSMGSWPPGTGPLAVIPGRGTGAASVDCGRCRRAAIRFRTRLGAAGHRDQFLAGLELPEHRFQGAGSQLVVLGSAGMPHAPDGPGGGRILVQVPGPLGRAPARPAGVFGQRREQPQLVLVRAGEVLLADVTGVGEDGRSSGRIPAAASCWRQVSSKGAAGSGRQGAGRASRPRSPAPRSRRPGRCTRLLSLSGSASPARPGR